MVTINILTDCLVSYSNKKKKHRSEKFGARDALRNVLLSTRKLMSGTVKRCTSQVRLRARLVAESLGPVIYLPPYAANASAGLPLFYYAET